MSGIQQTSGNSTSQALQWLKTHGAANASASGGANSTSGAQRPDIATLAEQSLGKGDDQAAIADLRTKIESAVADAVKNTNSSDPKEVGNAVRSAIDQTLKDAGVDVESFKSQLGPAGGGKRPGGPPAGGAPPSGARPSGPPPGGPPPGGKAHGSGSAEESSSTSSTSTDETEDDFWKELFASATQESTDQSTNGTDLTQIFAALFKNFPNGSGVDVTA
jgi:hypothetical protein